jgi:aminopeptidase YwaD
LTAAEKEAAHLIVERVAGQGRGFGGGGGGGGGRGVSGKIPQHMSAELNILLGKAKSALEIRDFLSGEFEPLPLADLLDYLRAQEKAGSVRLNIKP